jgi:hypothetical protein
VATDRARNGKGRQAEVRPVDVRRVTKVKKEVCNA